MVYWADIVHDKPLNPYINDKTNPYYLEEIYTKAPKDFLSENHDIRLKVVDFLSDQLNKIFLNEDKSLNYSYVSDLIVHKYFRDLDLYYEENLGIENDNNSNVKELIRNRLVETLIKYKNYQIMIVAHSMGSIIAYDVLNFLVPEITIHTLVTIGSPLGLPIIVSKIANEQKKFNNHSGELITPPGVKKWFNLADILDKIALNYKLADDFTVNSNNVGPVDFLVTNNYQMNVINNPHKSYGYLRTQKFTEIINSFIGYKEPSLANRILHKFKDLIKKI